MSVAAAPTAKRSRTPFVPPKNSITKKLKPYPQFLIFETGPVAILKYGACACLRLPVISSTPFNQVSITYQLIQASTHICRRILIGGKQVACWTSCAKQAFPPVGWSILRCARFFPSVLICVTWAATSICNRSRGRASIGGVRVNDSQKVSFKP